MSRTNAGALAHASIGAVLLAGIWLALPARYLLVDVLGTLLAFAAFAAAAGLWLHKRWGLGVARAVAWMELVLGTLTVSALAWSASLLAGSYGPVGDGGAVLMGTVGLLVLPYLVVLPALQLVFLRDAT